MLFHFKTTSRNKVLRESCNTDEEAAAILPFGVSVAPIRIGRGGEILKREEYMGAFNSSAQERDLRA